jgi:N-acyl amino acid synthase FeeM
MAGSESRFWGLGLAVRGVFDRLRARPSQKKSRDMKTTRSAHDADDAFTLFEGTDLRVHDLSVERLEDLQFDPGLLPGAFRIRVARTRDTSDQAGGLVRKRYASRGYLVPGAKPDPNLFTFVAYNSGDLVGTVSLRLDSSRGLSADELYKAEVNTLRSGTTRICEFTRLAIDVNAGSKWVLAGLFHTAYLFAHRVSGRDAAVIEVNPRHVVFYERALAFQRIGPERISPRVNAPAVLLCVRFHDIAEGLAKFASKPQLAGSTRSLFPYGFSAKDEEGILARLYQFDQTTGTRGGSLEPFSPP